MAYVISKNRWLRVAWQQAATETVVNAGIDLWPKFCSWIFFSCPPVQSRLPLSSLSPYLWLEDALLYLSSYAILMTGSCQLFCTPSYYTAGRSRSFCPETLLRRRSNLQVLKTYNSDLLRRDLVFYYKSTFFTECVSRNSCLEHLDRWQRSPQD